MGVEQCESEKLRSDPVEPGLQKQTEMGAFTYHVSDGASISCSYEEIAFSQNEVYML